MKIILIIFVILFVLWLAAVATAFTTIAGYERRCRLIVRSRRATYVDMTLAEYRKQRRQRGDLSELGGNIIVDINVDGTPLP